MSIPRSAVVIVSMLALGACRGDKFTSQKAVAPPPQGTVPAAGGTEAGDKTKQNPGSTVTSPTTGTADTSAATTGEPATGGPKVGTVTTGAKTDASGTLAAPVVGGSAAVEFDAALKLSTETQDKIRKCLSLWGGHPFKKISAANYKSYAAPVSVAGFGFNAVNDTEASTVDKLVVVNFALNLGGETQMKLMNPKGWYCLKGAVSAGAGLGVAHTQIDMHCTSRLAQSNLSVALDSATGAVAIGTGGETGSQLGILVDATVTLARKQTNGTACK